MKQKVTSLIFIFLILMIVLVPNAISVKHTKVLAVLEKGDILEGTVADLTVRIRSGTGDVYISTLPASKIDTQMSARFAKEIACSYIEEDCSNYDFFYKIDSYSSIVGGPSAGSAMAALTIAELKGWELNKKVTLTGTINSGGLVGYVGGLKEKIEAAAENNYTKVLIPFGGSVIEKDNESIDLKNFSKPLGVEIVEVSDLSDVMFHLTGNKIEEVSSDLEISPEYKQLMGRLARNLCERTESLMDEVDSNSSLVQDAKQRYNTSRDFFEREEFYSTASFCFGANLNLKTEQLREMDLSEEEVESMVYLLKQDIADFAKNITDKEMKYISDMETFIIVNERLRESIDLVNEALESKDVATLAYAQERFYSAKYWSVFFSLEGGSSLVLDDNVLRKACVRKISQAQERTQYVKSVIPLNLDDVSESIGRAYEYMDADDFELCIFEASKAESRVNTLISTMYLPRARADDLLEQKITSAEKALIKKQEKGLFPILGYSYYEYAKSLSGKNDTFSALLYAEYALELSDIDIYLESEENERFSFNRRFDYDGRRVYLAIASFLTGVFFAVLIFDVIHIIRSRKKHDKSSKKSKKFKSKSKPRKKA